MKKKWGLYWRKHSYLMTCVELVLGSLHSQQQSGGATDLWGVGGRVRGSGRYVTCREDSHVWTSKYWSYKLLMYSGWCKFYSYWENGFWSICGGKSQEESAVKHCACPFTFIFNWWIISLFIFGLCNIGNILAKETNPPPHEHVNMCTNEHVRV